MKKQKLIITLLMLITIAFACFPQSRAYANNALPDNVTLLFGDYVSAGFSTLEAAIEDFAKRVYGYTEYFRIECSGTLYRLNDRYYYKDVFICMPHDSVTVLNVPDNATIMGFIHTHPNSGGFSSDDKNAASQIGLFAYLVTSSYTVLRYDPLMNSVRTICSSFVPNSISNSEKNRLAALTCERWYGHFENGNCPDDFDCRNMQWPNDSSTQHGNTVYTWTENHYHSNTESAHYYEYGFKCTHCNVFAYTEWTSGSCRGGHYCITPWNLRDEPMAA